MWTSVDKDVVFTAMCNECDPKMAHVLNSKYGPNSANQMWSTIGKNVALSTKANQGVNQMWLSKKHIWASFGKDMAQGALVNVVASLKWPAYDGTNVAQLSKTYLGQFWQRYGTGSTG